MYMYVRRVGTRSMKLPKLGTPEQIELTLERIMISAATVQFVVSLCCLLEIKGGPIPMPLRDNIE